MRTIVRVTGIALALLVLLAPEALFAQYGHVHRATRRRTAVVVGTSVHAADEAAASSQQAAASQQTAATTQAQQQTAAAQQQTAEAQAQTAAAQQQAAEAQAQAAAAQQQAAAAAGPLPVGTVATTLPAGCVTTPVGGVEYFHCGHDYYRAAFQGNNLVYVTTEPPQ